jgi:hypothetical protein
LAIILYGTGDPAANTLAPPFASSSWSCVGFWGPFCGTAIGPHTFIAATHVGGSVGQLFQYQGHYYPAVSSADAPDGSDLTLWQVSGTFTTWAPLFNGLALGRPAVLMGRGTQRGAPMWVCSNDPLSPRQHFPAVQQLAGWAWGPLDGRLRWGTNVLSSGDSSRYCASFNSDGRDSCTASLGDSSGACFALDTDGLWKLAGVISYIWVSGPYANCPNGAAHEGAFTDIKWLYVGGDQEDGGYGSQTFITSVCPQLWWIKSRL